MTKQTFQKLPAMHIPYATTPAHACVKCGAMVKCVTAFLSVSLEVEAVIMISHQTDEGFCNSRIIGRNTPK